MVVRYDRVPCARCGILRKSQSKGRIVCRDCRYVMSDEEWAIWNDVVPEVELSHEKEAA